MCGPAIRLVLNGILFQCDEILVSHSVWWNNSVSSSSSTDVVEGSRWTQLPYREFIQQKGLILDKNQNELERTSFFLTFCNEWGLGRGTRGGGGGEEEGGHTPTPRLVEIDNAVGRTCLYASRLYTFCIAELQRLERAVVPDIYGRRMTAMTITQVMRTCLATRAALVSSIPTLLASPNLDCIDFLFLHFNQHLIDSAEITIRMNHCIIHM